MKVCLVTFPDVLDLRLLSRSCHVAEQLAARDDHAVGHTWAPMHLRKLAKGTGIIIHNTDKLSGLSVQRRDLNSPGHGRDYWRRSWAIQIDSNMARPLLARTEILAGTESAELWYEMRKTQGAPRTPRREPIKGAR